MRNKYERLWILLIVLLLVVMSAACSQETTESSKENMEQTADNAMDHISIVGLESGKEIIPIEKMKETKVVTKEMESITSSGEIKKNRVKGISLEDILQSYGTSQKNYSGIRFIAGDGYSIVVPKEVLEIRDIVLAYEIDDQPLDQQSLPLRVTIPNERAMYWVRNLTKIELLKEEMMTINKLFFLETATNLLKHEDYTYYESTDKAIKGMDIIQNCSKDKTYEGMFFKSVDGLEKKENIEVFQTGYIKVTGKDIPLFLSPELPKGMHIKDILWFSHGSTAYFSIESGGEVFEKRRVDEEEGIALKDIIKETEIQKRDKYLCKGVDGYELEISADDIDKGLIYINDKEEYTLIFEGLSKNTKVKQILSIESIK
ncbi:molybdopterin-dependent oxidoreductase [Clostridiaceae bacterium 35-E11]